MAFKVAFIGAGSLTFTRNLLRDILSVPEFSGIEIAFTDINEENLVMSTAICQRDIDANGLAIKIKATTDRRAAFKNAKYIVNCVRIGMLEGFETDVEIPLQYGVDQCVGDTICAGGIMYAQRGIAAMLEFCKDIRDVAAPNAIMLNYANPNAMVTWACNQYGGVFTIGLCHGVQHTHALIARAFGVPVDELEYICAGINHMTWFTQLTHKGKDMLPGLLEALEGNEEIRRTQPLRIDVLKRFGYFCTEGNGHLSEYIPWYRRTPEEMKNWVNLDRWGGGETGGYLRECREQRGWFTTDYPRLLKEAPKTYAPEARDVEHGSYIIESLETGRLYRGCFNLVNNSAISNLPDDCVVESPCYVDATGVHQAQIGPLPLGCAAMCLSNISVQRLGTEAAVHGDIALLRQAMLMDPLVGAVCNPPQVWQMVDDMLIAGEIWLPQYNSDIPAAKARRRTQPRLPTHDNFTGVARIDVQSADQVRENRAEHAEKFKNI
ncbi:MAG: alpha-glucosidase/alpha-galactosidase [Oscillospiraceae bacterium]|jgi:alpha-galactosidase|nr:alpha-glucosidase/alpha-galactosidase [Oscillospiraceae bacterium]